MFYFFVFALFALYFLSPIKAASSADSWLRRDVDHWGGLRKYFSIHAKIAFVLSILVGCVFGLIGLLWKTNFVPSFFYGTGVVFGVLLFKIIIEIVLVAHFKKRATK